MKSSICSAILVLLACSFALAEDATIRVDARQPGRPVSPYLTGACIEDVNHEVYGGIYSQMIFGESFQEPATTEPVKGFAAIEGEWRVSRGEIQGGAGAGPKLVSTVPPFLNGEAGVEVYLPGAAAGNAGLMVRVNRAGPGADRFDGYEVSIDVARKRLILGRHQHSFRSLKEVDCDVSPDRWIALSVRLAERTIEVLVDGKSVLSFEDPNPLPAGTVGLRQWQRPARYRNLWVKTGSRRTDLPFEPSSSGPPEVSRMWGPIHQGTTVLNATVEKEAPFVGSQSQRITFASGAGEAGIENQGLNRQGMAFVSGKPYEGHLWLRAPKPAEVYVSLESRDGARSYAQTRLSASGEPAWRRYDFTLTPDASDSRGRFAIRLKAPGSVDVGYVFLQPGEWGRFKGLPDRRDVVEGLIDQGISVLRYGGSMVNAPEYRWKKMIGPRDRRPPYHGTWYPYSSNGWGIPDFLNFCEAAGFLAVPDFNIDESPQDMADFIEYANGPADSEWGRKRAADGHSKPYGLTHLELGNEERVDETYFRKFSAIAQAIWAKDPHVILVVGDFAYDRPIQDPMKFSGSASRITSLAAHQKILELAREHGREVWFDVHLGTEGPGISNSVKSLPNYIDAIDKISAGAKHHVVVFELNANNHSQRRALANAQAIGAAMRDGRLPVVTSANCLQVDGQNDNDWNQGLQFLNPSKVWLQPPGYVTRMLARTRQPRVLDARVSGSDGSLDVTVTRSDDGKTLVLQVVNLSAEPRPTRIELEGFTPSKPAAQVDELAGPLEANNTANEPTRIVPKHLEWKHQIVNGTGQYTFPPHSFTVLRLE